ncbi:nitrogen fixation protein FixH [Ramlibacter sp. MMS24-I3-19]|uniref:nitrogen fixation protein FixH n=1 Tax=Ramlibacter sp. MMS24-I3-19 TaxID=3416606 RepID=UPI003D00FEC4
MTPDSDSPRPWWRHGHLWLVIAGPAIVVLASIATLVLAARGADPLVEEPAWRRSSLQQQRPDERARVPALQARNHAATPAAPNR